MVALKDEKIVPLKIDCNESWVLNSQTVVQTFFTSLQLRMINNVIDLKWVPRILVYKACTRRGRSRTGSWRYCRGSTGRSREAKTALYRAHRNDNKAEIDLHSPFPEYIPYNLANVTSGSNYEGYNKGSLLSTKVQV